ARAPHVNKTPASPQKNSSASRPQWLLPRLLSKSPEVSAARQSHSPPEFSQLHSLHAATQTDPSTPSAPTQAQTFPQSYPPYPRSPATSPPPSEARCPPSTPACTGHRSHRLPRQNIPALVRISHQQPPATPLTPS